MVQLWLSLSFPYSHALMPFFSSFCLFLSFFDERLGIGIVEKHDVTFYASIACTKVHITLSFPYSHTLIPFLSFSDERLGIGIVGKHDVTLCASIAHMKGHV